MSDAALLAELEPVAARLLERHLETTREWFPHELVPYDRARSFEPGQAWAPEDADLGGASLSEGMRSALFVNLLTEDNLPYYFRSIERMFGVDGAWGTWARRWTAEEGRHSMAIYGYLMASRAIDPVALERGRMVQVSGGETPEPRSALHGFAYLTMQELATRVSHRNTGKLLDDPAGYDVMARVAADENLHHLFYRDLTTAGLEADPSGAVIAIADEVLGFAMPGGGIPDFERHANAIAREGIYDLPLHHDQILVPLVLRHWNLPAVTGLSAAAEVARDKVLKHIDRLGRVARRVTERRQRSDAAATV